MANAKIGSYSAWNGNFVESLDTTGKQLTRGDSGKVFMCDQNSTADVEVFLPQLTTKIAGWHATFILRTASSNDFFVTAFGSSAAGSTSGDSDTIIALELSDEHSMSGAADAIQFVADNAVAGEYAELFTDGSKWYARQFAVADNAANAPN